MLNFELAAIVSSSGVNKFSMKKVLIVAEDMCRLNLLSFFFFEKVSTLSDKHAAYRKLSKTGSALKSKPQQTADYL